METLFQKWQFLEVSYSGGWRGEETGTAGYVIGRSGSGVMKLAAVTEVEDTTCGKSFATLQERYVRLQTGAVSFAKSDMMKTLYA